MAGSREFAQIAVTQSQVVLKSIRYPLLNEQVTIADYSDDPERSSQTGTFPITGRSFPLGTTDVTTGLQFPLALLTKTAQQARRVELALALGDILYLQVPANVHPGLPSRSMYLVAGRSRIEKIGDGAHRRFTTGVIEVAAPSPLVVGATLTWANVFVTFGNWSQLITASPTWFDLLSTVGDPEDLVVL